MTLSLEEKVRESIAGSEYANQVDLFINTLNKFSEEQKFDLLEFIAANPNEKPHNLVVVYWLDLKLRESINSFLYGEERVL